MFRNVLLGLLMASSLVGCASVNQMPLQPETSAIDTSEKSLLVARVTIKNENAVGHQPDLLCIFLSEGSVDSGELLSFTEPTLISDNGEQGKDYLVSLAVKPGKVRLNYTRFLRSVPLLLMATADMPLDQEVEVPANAIVYLGNINAVIVPRTNDDQPRAGALVPLIDQSVAGFSDGTFKIEISDQYDQDLKLLREKFPLLADKTISKHVLAQPATATAKTSSTEAAVGTSQ